jgi:hypothetical protein
MDASGKARIISERMLDTDEEMRACFIDCQKAYGQVSWIKLIQILKNTGMN